MEMVEFQLNANKLNMEVPSWNKSQITLSLVSRWMCQYLIKPCPVIEVEQHGKLTYGSTVRIRFAHQQSLTHVIQH